jgi:hypothetical protein
MEGQQLNRRPTAGAHNGLRRSFGEAEELNDRAASKVDRPRRRRAQEGAVGSGAKTDAGRQALLILLAAMA